jgi:asparagine synthase (glutamine-hydrolysing)
LERFLWHQDEAFFVSNFFLDWSLSDTVRRQGVRTLLDGVDGDTVVSHGEMYLTELARQGRWKTLAAEARALSKRTGSPLREVIRDWVLSPLAPEPARYAWRALRKLRGRGDGRPPWDDGDNVIKPDFAGRIGLTERYLALEAERSRTARTEREDHLRHVDSGMNSLYFEEDDKTAAAFSVRFRYPFYDKRVVEFCLALPPDQKRKRGWDRVILRRAMDGLLPKEVQWRPGKTDLSPTFDRGLLKYRRELMEEVIFDSSETIEEYVDVPSLRDMYRRFASRGEGEESTIIWGAVTLAVWLRQTGLSP